MKVNKMGLSKKELNKRKNIKIYNVLMNYITSIFLIVSGSISLAFSFKYEIPEKYNLFISFSALFILYIGMVLLHKTTEVKNGKKEN